MSYEVWSMKRGGVVTNMVMGMCMLALPLSVAAFSWRDFWGGEADDFESEATEGVTIENDISVSAGTGGNSASGKDGNSGGTVTTGEARASAKIQTSVHDDDFEDIRIEVETEGEPAVIERHIATSSGKARVQTDVRVEASATSSEGTEEVEAEVDIEERDDIEQTNIGDVFEDDEDEEIGTTTKTNMSELAGRNQERLRGFFKRLFSRLFSFFD